jgi:putative addiction module killer protein
MIEIRQTETFSDWLAGMRDSAARAIVVRRVARLANGNLGDIKSVGGGVSELRIHVGPGYRVYISQRSNVLIVLLCGGDKSSQQRDIRKAQKLAEGLD